MKPKKKHGNKKPCIKVTEPESVWADGKTWSVYFGELKKTVGHPGTEHLFKVVAEKVPYAALEALRKDVKSRELPNNGVYIAHDSMGTPRYIGRGNIFVRLAVRKKINPLELAYFSFYIVKDKKHEREIETLLIHMAGSLLEFNDKKKRTGIARGSVRDCEAGTKFYERRRERKKKKS